MTTVSITHAKTHLSALLERVREGESIVITDRGRPVARLAPPDRPADGNPDARLEHLERAGLIRRGRGRRVAQLLEPGPRASSSVVDALLDERRHGR